MTKNYKHISETLIDIFDSLDQGDLRFSWSGFKFVAGIPKPTDHTVVAINKSLAPEFFALIPYSDCVVLRNLIDTEHGAAAKADLLEVPKKLLKQQLQQYRFTSKGSKQSRELESLQRQYLRREGLYQ